MKQVTAFDMSQNPPIQVKFTSSEWEIAQFEALSSGSLRYMGATIEYIEDVSKSSFQTNSQTTTTQPNLKNRGCGCGK